jgi:vitamin B12 transporter
MKLFTPLLTLALASSVSSVFAENKLEESIVSATRTPLALSEALSSVSLISRADIERFQAIDIFDLLSRSAGVNLIRNGGRGSATSLQLRGNQSDHTLILIDGIRTGSATLGLTSLSFLNLASIERIEIIRGPKSSLYGADAIGGVINIITRKIDKAADLALQTSFGSNKTREHTLAAGFSNEKLSAQIVANIFDTDGIDNTQDTTGVNGDNDAFRNNTLSFNSRYAATDDLSFQLRYNTSEGESEYDSGCTNSSTFAPVACEIFSKNTIETTSFSVDYKLNDQVFTRFQAGQSRDDSENLADNVDLSSTFNGGEFNTTRQEATWFLQYQAAPTFGITGGVDYLEDKVTGSTEYDETSRYNQAAFLQAQFNFGQIDMLISTRLDDNEQFGEEQTSAAQLAYKLNDAIKLVASYGEAFKAPTFNDLYFPNFGNPDFVPETAVNYELSFLAHYEDFRLAVSAYQNEIENLIQFNTATFITDQTAEAEISGVDIEFETYFDDWTVGINSQYLDPRNKVNDKLLRRRPRYKFSFDLDRNFDNKLSLGYSFVVEGRRYEDVSNDTNLGAYGLSHIRTEYRFDDTWSLRLRVNNLFDKRYTTARDFSLGDYQSLGRENFIELEYRPEL